MTGLLARLPGLVADRIADQVAGLKECDGHAGRFDLAELKTFSTRAPAVRVALLAASPERSASGPQRRWSLRVAAFVVTRDAAGLDRSSAALMILERLLLTVEGARWGEPQLGAAYAVEAQNLYGAGTRDQGVALWAVSWRQPVAIEAAPDAAPLDLSVFAWGGPDFGESARDDYVEIGGAP